MYALSFLPRLATTALILSVGLLTGGFTSPLASHGQTPDDEAPFQRRQPGGGGRVHKDQVTPHWFHNDTRFWYRNDLRGGEREFILVDAGAGTRQVAFDHAKLAAGLSKAVGKEFQARKLPFDGIEFVDDNKAVRFKVGDATWKCDLASYDCMKIASPEASLRASGDVALETAQRPRQGDGPRTSPRSPDGKWTAFVKDHNLWVRPSEGDELQLSTDGKEGLAYGMPHWAPDSKSLLAFRIEPGDNKDVHLIQSSPPGGGRVKLQSRPYPLPGDKFAAHELNLFDIAAKKQMKPEVDRIDFGRPTLRWKADGKTCFHEKVDRGHQRYRVIEVDTHTGHARNLIDEKTETFIWTAHRENVALSTITYLEKTDEIIHVSERDGWRHLYLIDAKEGRVKNQITKGPFVVRGIDQLDADKRQVWFRASGMPSAQTAQADQDPYFMHYCRINFDGSGLVALTEGDGTHTITYSPDRKYLIDKYERVDLAPVHELRRASDGKLVCKLEEADIGELKESGWTPPEVFVAKGRDGKTDIWGIIARPRNFDPNKKYPVIEDIYAGPQGSFVPKRFSSNRLYASLTDLGFIVVKIDGMGTANRSKAFHDVCWKNLKDAGFPDRILWHQAVAKKYPAYDISRVGIYGGSAGGQNAMGGLLFQPDFYKVGVAGCGCHDNRMDKASWNEQWMGYPVGPQYAESSNVDNAYRLKGKLMLIVGEMDTNVPTESTLRVVDALVRAGKDFDFVFVPNAGHGMGGAYGARRMQDFFVRHLLGGQTPERNATVGRGG